MLQDTNVKVELLQRKADAGKQKVRSLILLDKAWPAEIVNYLSFRRMSLKDSSQISRT